jgi:hypothetical protein
VKKQPQFRIDPQSKQIYEEEIIKCMDDFFYFCRYLKIVDKNGQLVELAPKEAQRSTIEALINKNPWQIVLKARQLGLSTIIAAYFIWKVLFNENQRALVVAHTGEASSNIFKIYKRFYENLPSFLKLTTLVENTSEIVLKNGSSIKVVSASSESARGSTANLIHCSEVAFWRDAKTTVASLLQTAGINPTVILESTANGLNEFFNFWSDGESGYNRLFFPWTIDPDYVRSEVPTKFSEKMLEYAKQFGLSQERLNWAQYTFSTKCANNWSNWLQEYAIDPLDCFITTGDRVFDESYPNVTFKTGYQQFEDPKPCNQYVMGVDTASGSVNGDYSAFVIVDVTNRDKPHIVATYIDRTQPLEYADFVHMALQKWQALAVIETNNVGITVLERLREHEWSKFYTRSSYDSVTKTYTEKLGFTTTAQSRPKIIATLQSLINNNMMEPICERLRFQMNTFIYNANGRPDHSNGNHDDLILATAIALEGIDQAYAETLVEHKQMPASLAEQLTLEIRTGMSMKQLQQIGYIERPRKTKPSLVRF